MSANPMQQQLQAVVPVTHITVSKAKQGQAYLEVPMMSMAAPERKNLASGPKVDVYQLSPFPGQNPTLLKQGVSLAALRAMSPVIELMCAGLPTPIGFVTHIALPYCAKSGNSNLLVWLDTVLATGQLRPFDRVTALPLVTYHHLWEAANALRVDFVAENMMHRMRAIVMYDSKNFYHIDLNDVRCVYQEFSGNHPLKPVMVDNIAKAVLARGMKRNEHEGIMRLQDEIPLFKAELSAKIRVLRDIQGPPQTSN